MRGLSGRLSRNKRPGACTPPCIARRLPVRADSCRRFVAARRRALPVAVGRRLPVRADSCRRFVACTPSCIARRRRETAPGTSRLLSAICCACTPSCIACRRRETAPGTSRLLSAICCACTPSCIACRRRGDGSRYEPAPVGDLLRLHACCALPSPSGDGSGTSRLLSAICCACTPVVHCRSPSGDGSGTSRSCRRFVALDACCALPSPSGDGSYRCIFLVAAGLILQGIMYETLQ